MRVSLHQLVEFHDRLVKPAEEKQRNPDGSQIERKTLAWAQAQEGRKMLKRHIRATDPIPENAGPIPAARITRIEHKSTIRERHGYIDILIKISEYVCSVDENFWTIWGASKRLSGKLDGLAPGFLAIIRPTVEINLVIIVGNLGARGAIIRVKIDCPLRAGQRHAVPVCLGRTTYGSARKYRS